jgi:DNA modification methylase
MAVVNIHPFPARMASELALAKAECLPANATVLDPMMGSGTVVQAAAAHGLRCTGMDVDPLAVLMARVATSRINPDRFASLFNTLISRVREVDLRRVTLPWVDRETGDFIDYWFAPEQRRDLTRIAFTLDHYPAFSWHSAEANALRLALSKIIITKDRGASLARDVSHSRPHKVGESNNFDVLDEFEIAAGRLLKKLEKIEVTVRPTIRLGDARRLTWVRDRSVDMLMTSPPYLNAIDYMRGHRLSLVWLGHSLSALRAIRQESIGAERASSSGADLRGIPQVREALGKIERLPDRFQGIIGRYARDLILVVSQAERVLKPKGSAVFVVGNSNIRDVFVNNSKGLEVAAKRAGLKLVDSIKRKIPLRSRYLPLPRDKQSSLGKRMRTEVILTFCKISETRH